MKYILNIIFLKSGKNILNSEMFDTKSLDQRLWSFFTSGKCSIWDVCFYAF